MGKRIAEQVRRALIVAAKVAPVTVLIDASGCGSSSCAVICQISRPPVPDGGTADLVLPVVAYSDVTRSPIPAGPDH